MGILPVCLGDWGSWSNISSINSENVSEKNGGFPDKWPQNKTEGLFRYKMSTVINVNKSSDLIAWLPVCLCYCANYLSLIVMTMSKGVGKRTNRSGTQPKWFDEYLKTSHRIYSPGPTDHYWYCGPPLWPPLVHSILETLKKDKDISIIQHIENRDMI